MLLIDTLCLYFIKAECFHSDLGLCIKKMKRLEVAVLCSVCHVACTAMKVVCGKVQSAKEQSGNTVHCGMKCMTPLLM